jgi:hypothetical protein
MRPFDANTPVEVPFPIKSLVAKALVEDAIDANKEVVVAFVAVALLVVMPPANVEDADTITPIVVVGTRTPFTTFQSLKTLDM